MTAPPQPIEKISATKFKATSLSVLTRVETTKTPVQITRYGRPIAQIIPVQPDANSTRRKLGIFQGQIEIVGDIMAPAFDASDWDMRKD
jgi:prevent-host-death family protein